MNAKKVLSKILTLLSTDEVNLTYAKLKDGTIVESPTFDVGEDLFVVSEDGTKTPAPDGEHELALKDSEGNEVLIKAITKDGKIVERENVELEDVKIQDIPQASGDKEKANEVKDQSGQVKSGTLMAEETEEVETIPQDDEAPMKEEEDEKSIEIEFGDMKKKIEEMAYRIEEMEKKMMEMEKVKEEVVDKEADIKEEDDIEEMELPKLDGAPIEEGVRFSAETSNKNYGKKIKNTQSNFLSKLYK
jgi:hypothetical protein